MKWQPSCKHLPSINLKELGLDELRAIRADIKVLDQTIMEELVSRPLNHDMATAGHGASPITFQDEG